MFSIASVMDEGMRNPIPDHACGLFKHLQHDVRKCPPCRTLRTRLMMDSGTGSPQLTSALQLSNFSSRAGDLLTVKSAGRCWESCSNTHSHYLKWALPYIPVSSTCPKRLLPVLPTRDSCIACAPGSGQEQVHCRSNRSRCAATVLDKLSSPGHAIALSIVYAPHPFVLPNTYGHIWSAMEAFWDAIVRPRLGRKGTGTHGLGSASRPTTPYPQLTSPTTPHRIPSYPVPAQTIGYHANHTSPHRIIPSTISSVPSCTVPCHVSQPCHCNHTILHNTMPYRSIP